MNIRLEQSKYHRTYDVIIEGTDIDCEINNYGDSSEFTLDTGGTYDYLNSTQLRLIADKLDELNKEKVREG